MLKITVYGDEFFDSEINEFSNEVLAELELEHSLVALSKWESKFEKPFLDKTPKTPEESLAYIECMILNEDYPPNILSKLSNENLDEINEYISRKMTATWFSNTPEPKNEEIITAELIYYWLSAFQISWEVQYWHLERLFTLVKVANLKNSKPKKMSKTEIARRNRELNQRRKQQLGTSG